MRIGKTEWWRGMPGGWGNRPHPFRFPGSGLGLSVGLSWGRAAALLLAGLLLASPVAARPERVVSLNLCTDQLAMLLAAPGQLVSVSHLARDPKASVMHREAAAYPVNRGSAEAVFLMRPDLVLAGTYTARPAVTLLRRLGVEVVELRPANRLSDVPAHLRQIGAALGEGEKAEAMAARFEHALAALRQPAGPQAPVAALYYPNGYTTGAGTLADDLLTAAGLRNLSAALGLDGGGILPLERLVMADPAMVITSSPYPGASRSEDILKHPALAALRARTAVQVVSDAEWMCGLPQVLGALESLIAARAALTKESTR